MTADTMVRVSAGTAAALGLSRVRVAAWPTTAYLMIGEQCANNCAFCAQARVSQAQTGLLSRVSWPQFPLSQVEEALATEGGQRLRRVCLQVVGEPGVARRLPRLVAAMAFTGRAVSLSLHPSQLGTIPALLEAGADRVAVPLDAATPGLYHAVKGGDLEAGLTALEEAARRFPGRITTHFIAGLGETEEDLARLWLRLQGWGVTAGLFAFTPVRGTRLAGRLSPPLDYYRRVQLLRWLIAVREVAADQLGFTDGRLAVLRGWGPGEAGRQALRAALDGGEAFRTSGCRDCNRPYYNERPGQVPYNYPVPLAPEEAEEAFQLAAGGIAFE